MKRTIENRWKALAYATPLAVATSMLIAASPATVTESNSSTGGSTPAASVANALSQAFRDVSTQVLPAVVAIENRPAPSWQASQPLGRNGGMNGDNPFKGTPFEDMFRGQGNIMPPPANRPSQRGIGSGVLIDPSGIILTNNHVVAGGGKVVVRTNDGREFTASEVLTDPKTDIAIVKIQSNSPLPFARLGDSDASQVGDWVIALGQPFGLESTVTAGIVSAKNRGIGITERENFIQTDAAINPGNSGGPLVNLQGEIVGINTAISSRNGGNDGIGFSVPSNLAAWVKDELLAHGEVQRSYLGVGIQPVSYELAEQLGVPARSGVAVTDVFPNTPALKTGLKSGDVIVKFNGVAITTPQQLQLVVERSALGKNLPVEIVRDGRTMTLTYEPEAVPTEFGSQTVRNASPSSGMKLNSIGVEVTTLTQELANQLGIEGEAGVVITAIQDDGLAATAGLEPGMVIKQVNRTDVNTPEEFSDAIRADKNGSILLLVRTEQGSRFIVIEQ